LRLQLLSLFALTELTSGQLHSSTNPPVDPSSAPSKIHCQPQIGDFVGHAQNNVPF
jgi:hypothetical protein